MKKESIAIFPQLSTSPQPKHHLFHQPNSQVLSYSQAGLNPQEILSNIIPYDTQEYAFNQILKIDSFQLSSHNNLSQNSCYFIIGDNEQTKDALVCCKPSRPSLMRQLINGILQTTAKIVMSIELIGTARGEAASKINIFSYLDYLGIYRTFTDMTEDSDLGKYHQLITLGYEIDGVEISAKVVKMVNTIQSKELRELLCISRTSSIVNKVLSSNQKHCVYYWCPTPTKKQHPFLPLFSQIMRPPTHFATQAQGPASTVKTLRTQTQSSMQNMRKKSKSNKRNKIPRATSKKQSSGKPSSSSNLRRQIFKNVENRFHSHWEGKSTLTDLVIQEKDRKIQQLEMILKEKNDQQKVIEETFGKVIIEKEKIESQYSELLEKNRDMHRQMSDLRTETQNARQDEAKIMNTITNYEQQIEELHGDVKTTLDKLHHKNQHSKEEVEALRKIVTQLKKKQAVLVKKHQKTVKSIESKYEQKVNDLTQKLTKVTKSSEKTLHQYNDKLSKTADKISEYSSINQSLLLQNTRMSKQLKECQQNLLQSQYKYEQICMKLRNFANFKESQTMTIQNILSSIEC